MTLTCGINDAVDALLVSATSGDCTVTLSVCPAWSFLLMFYVPKVRLFGASGMERTDRETGRTTEANVVFYGGKNST